MLIVLAIFAGCTRSTDDGAGIMGRLTKMAGYIQNHMPIGDAYDLSDQKVADLVAFTLQHERPVFTCHDEGFPHGGRPPTDIITEARRQQIRDGTFNWTEIEDVIPRY